jgi:hypothetical protein
MRQKVEALDAFKKLSAKNDGIELLMMINNTAFSFKMQKNAWQASHEAIRHFYMVSQGKHMSTQDYLKNFQNTVEVIEHTGGVVGKLPGLEDKLLVMKGYTLPESDDSLGKGCAGTGVPGEVSRDGLYVEH